MIRSIAPGLIAVVWAGQALAGAPGGSLGQLIAEGEQRWTRSPDPRNPVACATCHHDPDETRGWAASFPKYRPLPPPEGRVGIRSEEHTSELQSRLHLVCRLLLEKKK